MIKLTQQEIEDVLSRKICPSTPAEVLSDILEDTTLNHIANNILSLEQLNDIANGNTYIDEDIANKLDIVLVGKSSTRSMWRVLQLKSDLWKESNVKNE